METKNQTAQESAQSGVVDYAAALRQYHIYGRGRSMKKFCEDEGYDYWKFCKMAREGQSEMDAKIIADNHPVFIGGLRPEFCHFDANMKLMTVRDIEVLVRKYVDRPNEDNRYFGISVKLQNDGHFCLLVEENIYFAIAPKSVDESALKDWKTELKDWKMDSGRFAAWKYPDSGKKSLLSPDDDIWGLACSKNKSADTVSCTLIPKLSDEFIDIMQKLPDIF